jgi:Domain of unknown function (DUF4169)
MRSAVLDARDIRFSQSETTIVDGISTQLMGTICNDKPVGERVFRASIAPERNRSTFSVLMGTTMAELVNLKRFKKRREREQSERQAETNRALHGRTKSQRAADDKRATRERDVLDQHRIDGEDAS